MFIPAHLRRVLLALLGLALLVLPTAHAEGPAWWANQNVLVGSTKADFAPATQGQLKFMTKAAMTEMGANVPQATQNMVNSWSINTSLARDYAVASVGQLKAVSQPFYDQIELAYPWTTSPTDDNDFAIATIGQLKQVFNFDLSSSVDGDELPDWWENKYDLDPLNPSDAFTDGDNDGFSNFEEFLYGTNPFKADTDYDGIRDSEEVANSTDPKNPNSVVQKRIGYWQFKDSFLLGDARQVPLVNRSNLLVDGEWQKGLKVPTSDSSLLIYRESEISGGANINLARGTVRLWVKPSWSSVTAGGTGPQSWARLLEVGSWTGDASYGFWALHFDPDGTYIWFSTQDEFHQSSGMRTPNFSWSAGQWHQVAVTYSPTESKLYIDNVLVASSGGVTAYPNAQIRALGFSVGTNHAASERTGCTIDELETFNYPLTPAEIQAGFDANGDGTPNWWETNHGLDPTAPGGSSSDADGDGVSNAAEYAGGSNPQDYYSRPGLIITPAVVISSNNRQDAPDGGFTANALTVQVIDSATGQAIANAPVSFTTPGRGTAALLSAVSLGTPTKTAARNVRTDANGFASTYVFQPVGNDEPIKVVATSGAASADLFVRPWGLLGRWRMLDVAQNTSGVVSDDSGAGKNGNLHGSPATRVPWLQCDGVDDWVEVPGMEAAINGRDAVTIALWIRSDGTGSTAGDRGFIAGAPYNDPDPSDNPFSFRYDEQGRYGDGSNLIKAGLVAGGKAYQFESANNKETTEWQHLAFTWQSGQPLKLYINGQLLTAPTYAGLEPDPSSHNGSVASGVLEGLTTFFIGKSQRTPEPWKGAVAEVRVYSRALTEAEVGTVFQAGDSDGNGRPDRFDLVNTSIIDTDQDGLSDAQELTPRPFGTGTNPALFDSDGDGRSDYADFINVTVVLGQQLFNPEENLNDENSDDTVAVTWRFNGANAGPEDNHSLALYMGTAAGSHQEILTNPTPQTGLQLRSTPRQFFLKRKTPTSQNYSDFYFWGVQQDDARLRATSQGGRLRPFHNDLYRMMFYKTREQAIVPTTPNGTIAGTLGAPGSSSIMHISHSPVLVPEEQPNGHSRQWSPLRGKFTYEDPENNGNWRCSLNPYTWTFWVDADPDSDHDDLSDAQEIEVFGTNPNDSDYDNDGLLDGWEVTHGLQLKNPDTDGDGMRDGWEVANGFNPLVKDDVGDFDHDGLSNLQEFQIGTMPSNPDSDGDEMPDGWEVVNGLDPKFDDALADKDGDHWPNIYEYRHGTKADVTGQDMDPVHVPTNPPPVYTVDPSHARISASDNIFATVGEAVAKSQEHYLDSATNSDVYPNKYAVIRVVAGVYKESISLGKASVLLLGVPGPSDAVVELQSQAKPPTGASDYEVVDDGFDSTITVDDDSIIDGFVISHALKKQGRGITVANNGTFAPKFINCVIRANTADEGAGARIIGAAKFRHCTFTGNVSSGPFGSVIQNNGTFELTNSIVWNPAATKERGGSGPFAISYSDVRGGISGTGNLNQNPLLTSLGWLTAQSPARNAGQASESRWDVHGEPRPNGGVDLGADEFVDADGNDLPDWWTQQYFPGAASTTHGNPDNDGVDNLDEYLHGTNPALADEDNDGLNDSQELAAGTDSHRADTDSDGMLDGYEVRSENALDPLVDDAFADKDGDRWPNIFEFKHGTKVNVAGQAADPANSVAMPPPVYTVDGALSADDAATFKYKTIQGAINAAKQAAHGRFSVINVKRGIYTEAPVISGVELLLLGESGFPLAEIRRVGNGTTLKISSPAVVDGFAISHADGYTGWGVYTLNGINDSTLERRLINCVISHNDYGWGNGGAIYSKVVTLRLIHSTLFANNAGVGKGIYLVSGAIDIWNSIIWDTNIDDYYDSDKSEIAVLNGDIRVRSSIIRNGEYGGLNLQPVLDPVTGNIANETSPAINAAEILSVSQVDIRGGSRLLDGRPDIGAFEYRDLSVDTDEDGLTDGEELETYHTNILLKSSDPDVMWDGWEVFYGLNPLVDDGAGDLDSDGLSNVAEWLNGTDPTVKDSDGDGLSDGEEVNTRHTSPTEIDSDGDGIADPWELAHGLNPLVNDASANPDGDAATNLQEYLQGRNPQVADNPATANAVVDLKVFTPLDR